MFEFKNEKEARKIASSYHPGSLLEVICPPSEGKFVAWEKSHYVSFPDGTIFMVISCVCEYNKNSRWTGRLVFDLLSTDKIVQVYANKHPKVYFKEIRG